MRASGLVVLLLCLTSCELVASGQAQQATSSVHEASYTADGDIPGVTSLETPRTDHTTDDVEYAESPPYGGMHDPVWADCTGTVYDEPIRSESAVHALEHGAVWVAYSPDLSADDVATLAAMVEGVDYTLMSPYPGLDAAVSVQSWARQLKVESAEDPRLGAFLRIYRLNRDLTPELGATCANPEFVP